MEFNIAGIVINKNYSENVNTIIKDLGLNGKFTEEIHLKKHLQIGRKKVIILFAFSFLINIQTFAQKSSITIISPAPNSTVDGSITISATASDPDGAITKVEYLDGTTVLVTSTSSPYNFIWMNPSPGEHTITVRVTDSNGGVTTSSPITLTSAVSTGVQGSSEIFGKVYPNPTNGEIIIETARDMSNAKVSLINVLGEETVVTLMTNPGGASIDVSSFADGSYILIVKSDDLILKKRITIIK